MPAFQLIYPLFLLNLKSIFFLNKFKKLSILFIRTICLGALEWKSSRSRRGQKQIGSAGWNAQSGMATALLITIIALFMIFVAAGVYAVKNRQIWIAHGITAAMNKCQRLSRQTGLDNV